jgi:hypothetical protein
MTDYQFPKNPGQPTVDSAWVKRGQEGPISLEQHRRELAENVIAVSLRLAAGAETHSDLSISTASPIAGLFGIGGVGGGGLGSGGGYYGRGGAAARARSLQTHRDSLELWPSTVRSIEESGERLSRAGVSYLAEDLEKLRAFALSLQVSPRARQAGFIEDKLERATESIVNLRSGAACGRDRNGRPITSDMKVSVIAFQQHGGDGIRDGAVLVGFEAR